MKNEDFLPCYQLLNRISNLRSQIEMHERVDSTNLNQSWVLTKSLEDYMDGYFVEIAGDKITGHMRSHIQSLREQLGKLEEKLVKISELI